MSSKHIFRPMLPLLAAVALNAGETGVASGLNRFAVASYKELAQTRVNLIFSPFNIATSLSMALAGARGETAAGMAATLHQPYPDAGYSGRLAALVEELAKEGNANGNQLLTANNVWVQRGFSVLPEFQRTMKDIFRAPFTPLDFRGSKEHARQQINRWTEERTANKISNLFGPGSLRPDTRLVLTSAIYFLGKWESGFRVSDTHADTFKLENSGAIQIPFMHQSARFRYGETPAVKILEMRYRGTSLAFDVLLPSRQDGLRGLERSLTAESLAGWLQSLQARTVNAYIPRFRAESDFSLRETLSGMGMANAFTSAADFAGIDDRRDLCLSSVVHKAFVDVSEEGTEAAAATGTTVTMISMARPVVFRADHPFLFLIRDTRSGVILFAGHLLDPK